jgi:hypothetical protein
MSNINDILVAVAGIQSDISLGIPATAGFPTSVQMAYPYMRWDANPQECPFFMNGVKGGPTDFMATGVLQQVDTDVEMFLCIMPWESGQSLEGNLEYVLRWRDVVLAAFAAALRLGSLPPVLIATITEWDLQHLEYGSGDFAALKFVLSVREAFPLTVGS